MVLGRRYEVLDRIGAGGMGVVCRAVDLLTGREVALKRLVLSLDVLARHTVQSQISTDATMAAVSGLMAAHDTQLEGRVHVPEALRVAVAQEFRTLASLRHPHII